MPILEDVLTPREQQVLALRLGGRWPEGGEAQSYTLAEVGQRFQVTREGIRLREARALRKLQKVGIVLDGTESKPCHPCGGTGVVWSVGSKPKP